MGVHESKENGSYVHWVIILDGPLDPSDDGRSVKRYLRLPNSALEIVTHRRYEGFVCHSELKMVDFTHLDLERAARQLARESDLENQDWTIHLFELIQAVAPGIGDSVLQLGTVTSRSPDTTCIDPASF